MLNTLKNVCTSIFYLILFVPTFELYYNNSVCNIHKPQDGGLQRQGDDYENTIKQNNKK